VVGERTDPDGLGIYRANMLAGAATNTEFLLYHGHQGAILADGGDGASGAMFSAGAAVALFFIGNASFFKQINLPQLEEFFIFYAGAQECPRGADFHAGIAFILTIRVLVIETRFSPGQIPILKSLGFHDSGGTNIEALAALRAFTEKSSGILRARRKDGGSFG